MLLKKPLLLSSFLLLALRGAALTASTVSETGSGFAGEYEGLTPGDQGFITANSVIRVSTGEVPTPRYWHRLWACESNIYLYAGNDKSDGRLDDMLYFNGSAWSELDIETPAPRANYGVSSCGVLFGGIYSVHPNVQYFDDTWIFDGESWEEAEPELSPLGRFDHSLASTPYGVVLFGGNPEGEVSYLSDTWIFDPGTREWEEVTPAESPHGRNGHVSFTDSGGKVVIYGGQGEDGYLSDTWVFDPDILEWSFLDIEGPPGRAGAAVYYDPGARAAVLFGGEDAGGKYLGDFWVFHDYKWHRSYPRMPGGEPEERTSSAASYHSGLGEGIFFGGRRKASDKDEEFMGDTWRFDISTSGVYTSGVFDAGPVETELIYESIDFETSGGGGSVRFQIAASGDQDPAGFTGPGGSPYTYYTEPGPVSETLNNNRYFRYRFFLESDKPGSEDPFTLVSASITYNHVPGPPSPAGPPYSSAEDGGLTNARPARLAWYNAPDGDSDTLTYELEVASDKGFESILASTSGVKETVSPSYTRLTLDHGGPYYWRVRAFDGLEYGEYSDIWSIYIDTVPPEGIGTFESERPGYLSGAVRLSWTVPDEGVLYRIRWSETWPVDNETRWDISESNEAVFHPEGFIKGEEESFTVTGLKDAVTYWFAVRIQDEAGNLSELPEPSACRTNSPPEIEILSELPNEWGSATDTGSSFISFIWEVTDPDPEDYHEVDIHLSEGEGMPYSITAATGIKEPEYEWDTRYVRNAPGYLVRFTARDQRGLETESYFGPVRISNHNEPPEVSLNSPRGGESFSGVQSIDWEWSDPNKTDTVYFIISVSTDGGRSFTVLENYVPEWNIPYEWGTGNFPDSEDTIVKVTAVDSGGLTGSDTSGRFSISNTREPPEEFSLISPIEGQFIYSTRVIFTWEEAPDPDGGEVEYSLQISENPDFVPYTEYPGLKGTSHELELEDETLYYWRVVASDREMILRESRESQRFAVNLNPIRVVGTFPRDGDWKVMTGTETIQIKLNKAPDPYVILANHITLTDNYGGYARYRVSYDDKEGALNLIPQEGSPLEASRVYTVRLSTGIVDSVGHPLLGERVFSFARLLEEDSETSLEMPGAASARVYRNTFSSPALLKLGEPDKDTSTADRAGVSDPLTGGETVRAVSVSAYDYEKNEISEFLRPVELEFEYETDSGGFVRGMDIDARFLSVFSLSEDVGIWKPRESFSVSSIPRVGAMIDSPGIYAIRPLNPLDKKLSGIIVYPNPFHPGDQEAVIRFALTERMELTLDIYTQTGELVRSMEKEFEGSPQGSTAVFTWDGLNSRGMPVASGMYYAVLSRRGSRKEEFLIGVVR